MVRRLTLLLWIVLAVSASAASLTRLEIRQRLRTYWGEFRTTNSFYPDSVLNPIINDAQWYIAHFGQAIERETTFAMTQDLSVYNLPADFDGVVGVLRKNKNTKPIVMNFMPWEQFSFGAVEQYQYTIYNQKFYTFPIPEANYDSITVMFFGIATDLSADTSHSTLPLYWSRAVPVIADQLIRLKDQTPEQDIFTAIEAKVKQLKRSHLTQAAQKPTTGQ